MLDLATVKAHLNLLPAETKDDALVRIYMAVALAAFKAESKRRWPADGEPVLAKVLNASAEPPTMQVLGYVDPAVLSADEQQLADQWQLFCIGHLYENRQEVIADVRAVAVQVPQAGKYLMNLLREPTL
jgi:hypothetical protein